MSRRKRLLWALLGYAVGAAFSSAHAQYDIGPPVDYHVLNQQFMYQWQTEEFQGPGADSTEIRYKDERERFVPPSTTVARFVFDREETMRGEIQADFIARVREESPSDADRLAEVDVFGLIGSALAGYGLSVDDLADTLTLYLTEAYQSARREEAALDADTAQAVRDQVVRALTGGPHAAMSDAERQRLSDTLVLQSYLIYGTRAGCLSGELSPCDSFFAAMEEQAAAMFGAPADEVALTSGGFQVFGGVAGGKPARVVPAWERSATGEGRGACGFPVRTEGDRAGQDVLAKMSMCDEYQGAR